MQKIISFILAILVSINGFITNAIQYLENELPGVDISEDENNIPIYLSNGKELSDLVNIDLPDDKSDIVNPAQYQTQVSTDGIDFTIDIALEGIDIEDAISSKDAAEESIQKLADYIASKETIGSKIFSGVASGVSSAATKYLTTLAVNSLLKLFGIDMRDDSAKCLEKLQMLDDIYDTVKEIDKKIESLCKNFEESQYIDLMNERNEALVAMDLATKQKYLAVLDYLQDGYEEYLADSAILDTFLDIESYVPTDGSAPLITEDYIAEAKEKIGDKDFMIKYLYMHKKTGSAIDDVDDYEVNSLALYMAYRLETSSDEFKNTIGAWANTTVATNSAVLELKVLMNLFAGGYYTISSMDSISFPEIYDYYATANYAWEHEGYEFREYARTQDAIVINEAYTMAEFYYTLFGDNILSAKAERKEIQDLLAQYNEVLDAHPVERHDDYLICTVEGCEYVFDKDLVYYNYYTGLLNLLDVETRSYDSITEEGTEAYINMFYNRGITYDYNQLKKLAESATLSPYYSSIIKEAYNPYKSVDFDEISEFATPIADGDSTYLPLSAYQALYDFYQQKYPEATITLKDIIESIFDTELSATTYIVTDVTDLNLDISVNAKALVDDFYIGPFKLHSRAVDKYNDSIYIRTAVNDDASGVETVRFAYSANVSGATGAITNKGSSVNAFCGLMVLGSTK